MYHRFCNPKIQNHLGKYVHYVQLRSLLLIRLSAATDHSVDQTISSTFRLLGASHHLVVRAFALVVAPSSFEAWIRIVSFEMFPEFTQLSLLYFYKEAPVFKAVITKGALFANIASAVLLTRSVVIN